jgi:hypothetical protein
MVCGLSPLEQAGFEPAVPFEPSPKEGGGFELPVPGHGKLCQTSILFVLLPGGADVAHSATAFARATLHRTEGHLWADLTAPLEAAPR